MNINKVKEILENRVTSSYNVSVGTGLLLESMFNEYTEERYDKDREPPNKINPSDYNGWFFNVYTFIRNFIGSLEEPIELTPTNTKLMFSYIVNEINTFYSTLSLFDLNNYVIMYLPDYSKAIKNFNVDKDYDVGYIQNNISSMDVLRKHLLDASEDLNLLVLENHKLPKSKLHDSKLITSHFTIDLLNSNNLTLLESNTGKLKEPNEWYTKYHKVGNDNIDFLPMIDIILYYLGDNQLVRGLANKVKKKLLALGIEKKWNIRTTRDKIQFDVSRNDELKAYIKNFKGF